MMLLPTKIMQCFWWTNECAAILHITNCSVAILHMTNCFVVTLYTGKCSVAILYLLWAQPCVLTSYQILQCHTFVVSTEYDLQLSHQVPPEQGSTLLSANMTEHSMWGRRYITETVATHHNVDQNWHTSVFVQKNHQSTHKD